MSRKKGLRTFDYAKADKVTAVARAKHGDDWGIVRYVDIMREMFRLDREHSQDELERQSFKVESNRVVAALREAIENRDGSYFQKLAYAVENQSVFFGKGNDADPLRAFLLKFCFDWNGKQKRKMTTAELIAAYNKTGFTADRRNFERACDALKIKRTAAKTGRPINSGNSSKR